MIWFLRPGKLLLITALCIAPVFGQQYKLQDTIPLEGSGGWDYLTADSGNRKLYVSHDSEVIVVDLDSNKVAGHVTGLKHIHGIAVDAESGTGFISDGGANEIVAFKLNDLASRQRIKVGQNPDAILYEPASKHVFTFNGRSSDASVVDPVGNSVIATISMGGKPEFAVSDGKGNVFVNIEDKNQILRIDSKTAAVKDTWPIAPCDSPSGLAIDRGAHRLFSVCRNEQMAVIDAQTGKVVASPAIGKGPDAAIFDGGSKLAFSSNGRDGTLTVVKQNGPSQYEVLQNASTALGARTMALDEKTHKIYLVTAEFDPPPAATADNPRPRPSMKPGTFKLLVMAPQ